MILDIQRPIYHALDLAQQAGAIYDRNVMQDIVQRCRIKFRSGKWNILSIITTGSHCDSRTKSIYYVNRFNTFHWKKFSHSLRNHSGPTTDI